MNNSEEKYISLQEAAKFCNYSQEYLSLRARQGKLKAVKIGRNWVTKKEWLEEYLKKVEEYNNNYLNNKKETRAVSEKKFISPPKNLPVEEISLKSPMFRFGFSLAIVFVLLITGIVFGQESFKNVLADISPLVQEFGENFDKGLASQIENWKLKIENLADDVSEYTYIIGEAGDIVIAEIGKFISQSFTTTYQIVNSTISTAVVNVLSVPEKAAMAVSKLGGEMVEGLAELGSGILEIAKKAELTAIAAKEISQETIGIFKEFGQWVGESIKYQMAKIKDSFVRSYEFITQPWRVPFLEKVKVVEVKKEEIEKLQAEIKELKERPVKEIVREIEVSKVTKVEPIKEITKEKIITKIDDKELAKIKKELSSFALWGTDIENLRAITQKLQANPAQTPVATAPIYIGSQGIQVGGIGQFASLGVSGSAGVGSLGVGGSASIGSTASDKLTVAATSEFNAPVFAKEGLTVGRGTLNIDEKGNLTTTGRITVKSDLIIEKNLIVHGVQTHSGLTIAGPVITSATGVLSSEAQLAIARGGTGLSALGTANQLLGVNAGATGLEYKTLFGTTNQITVTHAPGSITLATPQDIHTGATPTFTSLTLTGATPLTLAGTSPVTIARNTTTADILAIDNLGIGTLSLNLVDGGLRTAGTERLTNAGALTNITGITSSGTITFSGLTADRLVTTTTGGALATSISSANLALSVTDETGSGLLVFNTSPSFTTSVVTGSASFDVFNTTATTINAFGAATALTIGATSGTTTIRNTNLVLSADSAVLNFSSITGTKQIQTGGTTHLALMPGGNVGIGTTAPGARLDVVGAIKATGNIGSWGSFTVGGTSGIFYPVQFRNDAPGASVSSDLMIYRSSIHANGLWFGTFMFKVSFHPTNWGHFGGQIEKIEYLTGDVGGPYNDPVGDIVDGSTRSGGDDVIIWLRGGATYEWKTMNTAGAWTLLNGNPGGTSITDSSGIVRDPITSQSTLIINAKNRFYTNALSLGTAGTLAVDGTRSSYILGNVGIGTTAPGTLLTLRRSTTGNVFAIRNIGDTADTFTITDAGIVNLGTWQGTAIGAIHGGTGQTAVATGDILFGSATNTWSRLAVGASGTVLVGGTTPSWSASPSLTSLTLTGATPLTLTGISPVTIARNTTTADILAIDNLGIGTLSLNLVDGGLRTAGTERLTNAGALTNITGITSSGTITFSGLTIAGPVITSATGVLSSEAQLAIARGGTGLSALGTANQLLGVNAGATGLEYKTISGTTNQITVTQAIGSITLATPQDIATTSSPTFAALTLSGTTPLALTGTSPVTIARNTTTADILAIDNLGIGTLSLNLVDGGLRTAGIERLTNAGALTNITGITSSGTITFSGLTADRLVTTTTGGTLTTSITSANLAASVTDETGSGLLVFNTSPSFTTSITTPLVTSSTLTLESTGGILTLRTAATIGVDDIVFSPAGAERFRILENGDLFFEKGAFDVTLAVAAPAGATRTYTIPDFGANVSLVGSNRIISAGTGLTGGGDLSADRSLAVLYGATAGTATQGNITLTCPSGTGNLTGGGTVITLGAGGTCAPIDTIANPSFTSVTLSGTTPLTLTGTSPVTIARNTATADILAIDNLGIGTLSLNLVDGGLRTAGIERLTNAGALTNITGITSSGTITFSGLTADRLVTTTTGGTLTTSITSANLAASVTDETGSGLLVFGTSPSFTTSVATGSASFDVFNTTATTINAFGAATALTIGATTGTTTIRNTNLVLSADSAVLNFSSAIGTKQIQTGGTTHLALMPGGNVGIGTTAPQGTLHIASNQATLGGGQIRLTNAAFPGSGWAFRIPDTGTTIDLSLDREFAGWQPTPVMYFRRSDGHVGIGTTGPGTLLTLRRSTTGNVFAIRNIGDTADTFTITDAGIVNLGTWQGTAIGAIYGGTGQTAVATGDILFGSATNTWSRLAVGASGTVLVGGTIPSWSASPSLTSLTLTGATPLTLPGASPVTIARNTATADILAIDNLGIGTLSLNLVDGGLRTAGIERLTNAGALTNITGITSSGTITFSGLTADRLVTTTTGGTLTTSITSANLAASVTDETGSGLLVFGTSPSFTTSVATGSASFDVFNTTATTINAFGAATALTIGATTGTTTIRTPTLALSADSAILNFSSVTGTKQIQTGGTTHLALMPGGNVGIGTTAPGARLDVVGAIRATGNIGNWGRFTVGGISGMFYPVQFRNDAPGISVSSDLMIYRSDVHANGLWFGAFMFKVSFHPTNFGHFGGQIEKIEYLTGDVGGPYNDPVGDIVDGSAGSGGDDVIIWLRGGATYEWKTMNTVGAWTLLNGNPGGTSITDSSGVVRDPITSQSTLIVNAKNRFYTNALSLGTAGTLTVDGRGNSYILGNVGIGTTAPGTRLDVEGNANFGAGTSNLELIQSGQIFLIRHHDPGIAWRDISLNSHGGNVGIGMTTPPTHQLQLSLDSAAKPGTSTWTVISDIRVKKDIRPYTGGREVIRQINPVWYKYNGLAGFTADGKDHIGVIAQDIVNVAPYTVGINKTKLNPDDLEKTELLSFNSHALTFALINAFKEMDKEIEELKLQLNQNGDLLQNGQEVNSQFVNSQSNNSLIETIKQALASLGLVIENGIAKVKELFAEKIFTKTARVEKLEMVDKATGKIFCTWIENGEWQKVKSSCDDLATVQSSTLNSGEPAPACVPDWQCSDWQPLPETIACGQPFTQTRTCTDSNNCGTEEGKPTNTQEAFGTKDCSTP